MRRLVVLPLLALLPLAGCGSDDEAPEGSGTPSDSSSSSAASSESGTATAPASAAEMAELLAAAIPEISATAEVTESNDTNNLIGRPGQYTEAAWMRDSRVECDEAAAAELRVDCGAKLEKWPSADEAQDRADYIQEQLENLPALGTEWDYVRDDGMLLRVTGDIPPSAASAYESAFLG